MPNFFPFSAIVGQELMLRALVLNAVDPRVGGVLIRGERGTAKSTAARALAALLPPIRVIQGCRFNCDPGKPDTWCSECLERWDSDSLVPAANRSTPFVNLPISATEDRLVGTLDIERAIQKGERHFEAGILASANRGLLYIDEVNLLDDHVVDVLLDSAAMGVNIVEREGISFTHPSRFILVGTMNPEEGDLRPQLLDRFALSVDIQGIRDVHQRVRILIRCLEFEQSSERFLSHWVEKESLLSEKISRARQRLPFVTYPDDLLFDITRLTASFEVDGHRPDMDILKAARANAAFEERLQITCEDIAKAAELALPHRFKRVSSFGSHIPIEDLRPSIRDKLGLCSQITPDDLGVGATLDEGDLRAPYEGESSPWKNIRTGFV